MSAHKLVLHQLKELDTMIRKHSARTSRPQRDKSRTPEAKRATLERRASRAEKRYLAKVGA